MEQSCLPRVKVVTSGENWIGTECYIDVITILPHVKELM